MSIFINASGKRFIECNVCGGVVASNHGLIVNGSTNDIAPSDWKTEILRVPCANGYHWKEEHFCNKCKG